MIFSLPKKVSVVLFALVTFSQLLVFVPRYIQYFRLSDDPSLLANEIKAIDWVYEKAGEQGFSVYNYLPSVLDYPYQYLFWWYGQKKYGYLPSRRAGNPLYLIYEPDPYLPEFQKRWLTEFRSPDKGPVIGRKEFPVYTVEKFDKRGYGH